MQPADADMPIINDNKTRKYYQQPADAVQRWKLQR